MQLNTGAVAPRALVSPFILTGVGDGVTVGDGVVVVVAVAVGLGVAVAVTVGLGVALGSTVGVGGGGMAPTETRGALAAIPCTARPSRSCEVLESQTVTD